MTYAVKSICVHVHVHFIDVKRHETDLYQIWYISLVIMLIM